MNEPGTGAPPKGLSQKRAPRRPFLLVTLKGLYTESPSNVQLLLNRLRALFTIFQIMVGAETSGHAQWAHCDI